MKNKNAAFVIGQTKSYDKFLLEAPNNFKVIAKHTNGCNGSIIFKSANDAYNYQEAFLKMSPLMNHSNCLNGFSIYVIQLPNSWEVDAKENKYNTYYHLLNDALVLGKLKKSNKRSSVIDKYSLGNSNCAVYLTDLLNDDNLISTSCRRKLLSIYGRLDNKIRNIKVNFNHIVYRSYLGGISKFYLDDFIKLYVFRVLDIEVENTITNLGKYSNIDAKIISVFKCFIFGQAKRHKEIMLSTINRLKFKEE
jgi:hypothetical protein